MPLELRSYPRSGGRSFLTPSTVRAGALVYAPPIAATYAPSGVQLLVLKALAKNCQIAGHARAAAYMSP